MQTTPSHKKIELKTKPTPFNTVLSANNFEKLKLKEPTVEELEQQNKQWKEFIGALYGQTKDTTR